MAQTLIKLDVDILDVDIIFSTKNRAGLIAPEIETELFAYIGGIANNNNSKLIAANGTSNHVHLLVSMSKNIELSVLVGDVKRDSSKWIKTNDRIDKNLRWQDSYGVFSVGYTQIEDVKKYTANQKQHHAKISFEDEFRYFLNKYDVDYDERYIWD